MDMLVINKTNKRHQQHHYLDKVFSFCGVKKPTFRFQFKLERMTNFRDFYLLYNLLHFFFLIKVLEKMFVHSNLKCHYINLVIV